MFCVLCDNVFISIDVHLPHHDSLETTAPYKFFAYLLTYILTCLAYSKPRLYAVFVLICSILRQHHATALNIASQSLSSKLFITLRLSRWQSTTEIVIRDRS